VYSWIWSKLPGGLPGKLVGSIALSVGMLALLWFVVFPAVRPHMPWSNVDPAGGVNVENGEEGGPAEGESCVAGVDCPGTGFDPDDWETAESPE
jgi:hypothetical protein